MPWRVVLCIGELEVGGTQRQMLELAKRFDRRRFQPSVWVLSRSLAFAEEFRHAGVPVKVVEKHSRYDATILPRLRRKFLADGIHVLISFGSTADAWARVAARMARLPVIVSSVRTPSDVSKVIDLTNWVLASITDHYIVNSDAVRSYLRDVVRVPSRLISLIPNGIDLERFSPAPRSEVRHSLGLEADALAIGMVCRLSSEKNIEQFLRASRALCQHSPRSRFFVVGDGPERERLHALGNSLALNGSLTWLGERDDVPRILSAMDIAMLTSWRAGLSNAVLEYMAAGLPVVASAVGGTPAVIRHGESGLLFPAGDDGRCLEYLRALEREPALRERLGREARRDAEQRFSTTSLVRRTEDLLARLLHDKLGVFAPEEDGAGHPAHVAVAGHS